MRVLFITWETYPLKSATSNCLMAIISELSKQKIESDILNITGDILLPKETIHDKVKFINIFDSQFANVRLLFKKNPILAAKIIIKKIHARFEKQNDENAISKKTYSNISKKISEFGNDYDAFVAVCSHIMNGLICDDYCTHNAKKYLLYQVDPIGTNISYHNANSMRDIELKLYKSANYIITTPILAKEKENDPLYSDCQGKLYIAEFPNIKNLVRQDNENNNRKPIICFYSGRFYNGVRDCRYTLDVLCKISSVDFHLVFAGDGQEDLIEYYKKRYFKSRLDHLGMLNLSESFMKMQEADVLINIGNNVTNQVPSKLFDYISTGKPIINFCKSKECPTIPYIERYGLGINIIEGEESIERQAQIVSQFIMENNKKRIKYEEIEERFIENTPEYVGSIFANLLEKIIIS